ncbi:thermonuclease family protein [Chloroflexota bacterium]
MLVKDRKNSKIWLTAIILFLTPLYACSSAPETATVTRVIDGDTIIISTGQRVRYIGIDTPELRPYLEAFGTEAWQANRNLVENKEVRLETDVSETDKYDRLLRYVYVDDIFINAELVRLGLAESIAYPPDTRYQYQLEQLENEAKQAGRGMWAK